MADVPRPSGATGIAEADAIGSRPVALGLILGALLLALVMTGAGVFAIITGLTEELARADAPGELTVPLDSGDYIWTRARADAPEPGRSTLTLTPADPTATRLALPDRPRWVEINNVRFDVLVEVEARSSGPVTFDVRGGPEQFPIVLRRDQTPYLTRVGLMLGAGMLVPLGLLAAGIGIAARNARRREAALLEAMGRLG